MSAETYGSFTAASKALHLTKNELDSVLVSLAPELYSRRTQVRSWCSRALRDGHTLTAAASPVPQSYSGCRALTAKTEISERANSSIRQDKVFGYLQTCKVLDFPASVGAHRVRPRVGRLRTACGHSRRADSMKEVVPSAWARCRLRILNMSATFSPEQTSNKHALRSCRPRQERNNRKAWTSLDLREEAGKKSQTQPACRCYEFSPPASLFGENRPRTNLSSSKTAAGERAWTHGGKAREPATMSSPMSFCIVNLGAGAERRDYAGSVERAGKYTSQLVKKRRIMAHRY